MDSHSPLRGEKKDNSRILVGILLGLATFIAEYFK